MERYKTPRCQHIKTSGTQCGSPAVRDQKFCHFHKECRAKVVTISNKRRDSSPVKVLLPAFEDATSLQLTLRQVTELIMRNQIEPKQAGLLLYALQIASSNLRQMNAEKPRPTQVVIDPEKVAETPIGMTPWSADGEEPELEDADDPSYLRTARKYADAVEVAEEHASTIRDWAKRAVADIAEYTRNGGANMTHDSLVHLLRVMQSQMEEEVLGLEPRWRGTIQACAERDRERETKGKRYVV